MTHLPEQQLWASVLALGITDATGHVGGTSGGSRYSGTRSTLEEQAKSWIGTKDFYETCYLAGFDPHAIRERWEAGKISVEQMRKAEGVRNGKAA